MHRIRESVKNNEQKWKKLTQQVYIFSSTPPSSCLFPWNVYLRGAFLFSAETIFISPLDWGMGHATRIVPLIKELQKRNRIVLGVAAPLDSFFRKECPGITSIEMPSYGITYSSWLPAWMMTLLQTPKILKVMRSERDLLSKIISDQKISVVISDNRYGLYHSKVHCILITHQLTLLSPLFPQIANRINRRFIHKFNEVWVPDYEKEEDRLSGRLSKTRGIKIPVLFIGPQSNLHPATCETEMPLDVLILLSGPEPQRLILENMLLEKFADNTSYNITLIRGKDGKPEKVGRINVIGFATRQELSELFCRAGTVICRSGYSTLMDLNILKKKSYVLIPTPGQPEQEYLATYWKSRFGAKIIQQHQIKEMEPQHFLKN